MDVLVRVHVGDGDAGLLQLANLGGSLGLNFFRHQSAAKRSGSKNSPPAAKQSWRGRFGNQAWDFLSREQRTTPDQNNVTADAQTWDGLRQAHGFVKFGSLGHQSC